MISAVILSHNSEQSIKKTLDSVRWCDEIVVIDDNSSDESRIIAKKAGAKIFTRSLNEDFGAQRNFALKEAKGQWVLFVDSDEVISDNLRDEILFRCGKENDISGYVFRRLDWVFGKTLHNGESGRVRLVRLAKKLTGTWSGTVHEEWNVNGNLGLMKNPILHYPHRNVAQFLNKINTYSTLRASALFADNEHVTIWHILAFPAGKFLTDYVFYQGFRDGSAGMIHAVMMSFHSFLVRAKLWHLWDRHNSLV